MVYMYNCFLIHSSADGHLGCFHILAMINSAAMNIGVQICIIIYTVHWAYFPKVISQFQEVICHLNFIHEFSKHQGFSALKDHLIPWYLPLVHLHRARKSPDYLRIYNWNLCQRQHKNFHGGPVAKILHSQNGPGSIPGQGTRSPEYRN